MPDNEQLSVWTVCKHPRDYPDKYTARRHVITGGESRATGELLLADEIEALRTFFLERGFYRMPREPDDDPVIVESWL